MRTSPLPHEVDVLVVGGGLAGLAAAATAARAGVTVACIEARGEPGGRARTDHHQGFALNHGAHALYLGGAGMRVLRELGVSPLGRMPTYRGGTWVHGSELTRWRHLSAIGGLAGVRSALRLVSRRPARDAEGASLREWMASHVPADAQPFVAALVRTATYCADVEHLDAGAALAQMRIARRGVRYLDGGWSSLVDGLGRAASNAGVTRHRARATSVSADGRGCAVVLDSGDVLRAAAVVLAVGGPGHADQLLDGASSQVTGWAAAARPVRAAALDVALRRPPDRAHATVFGLGEPVYLVNHSRTARLAPEGGAVLHGLVYEPDRTPQVDPRGRLEALLDAAQPGWRDAVVDIRYRRQLVVAHDRPQPGRADGDRPSVAIDDMPGVFVAGDWLTGYGFLADAALGSAQDAGIGAATAVRAASGPTPVGHTGAA